jgi:hypothetical protein
MKERVDESGAEEQKESRAAQQNTEVVELVEKSSK